MKYGKEFYQSYNGQFAGDTLSPEIVRLSKPYIKGDVMDVGAGSGAMMNLLTRLDSVYSVSGLDIAPTSKLIEEGSINNMPFSCGSFDTIMCSEVLEHLDNETLKQGIEEIYRVLKPGGYVIITTPYKDELKNNMVKCPCCNAEFHRWGHIQSFNEYDLMIALSKGGFSTFNELKILPLGFMATHKILRHFITLIKNMPLVRYEQRSIFVVAQKSPTPQ